MAVPSRSQTRSATSVLRPLLEIGAARARLRDIIHQRSFGRGEIKLASGRVSDFYFNLKPAMLDAEGAALLAQLTLDALAGERIDYVGGVEMGGGAVGGAGRGAGLMAGGPTARWRGLPPKPPRRRPSISARSIARRNSSTIDARAPRQHSAIKRLDLHES